MKVVNKYWTRMIGNRAKPKYYKLKNTVFILKSFYHPLLTLTVFFEPQENLIFMCIGKNCNIKVLVHGRKIIESITDAIRILFEIKFFS